MAFVPSPGMLALVCDSASTFHRNRVFWDSCSCLDLQHAGGVVEELAGTLMQGIPRQSSARARWCQWQLDAVVRGMDSSFPSAEMHLPAISM